ncbi:glycine/betaine ABC transporter substrate-binding protein [Polycladomyces sp. WAk]|uniref:Glycine/betaine ABC transporter substrate-binding protein n=1 Tax=Polycladomyces zharkentensis TaxID=2807616 RepID=A0ABS2WLQ5_9BACL|nr:glycine betaine ABC transporter substrate-binding protein [Polycladomyces sp. WAk]MBN2910334.1 glycine/betaine ABC transporter substrate-binding protein [Polycladomyces sp. WAk]
MFKRSWLLSICLILLISLTACKDGKTAEPGEIVISGKNWTEQWILAHILGEYLKAHTDMNVQVREGLGTEAILVQALKQGEIDAIVEYTGTGYQAILKKPYKPGMTPQYIYRQTKSGYETQFGSIWLKPLGFYNTYALALRADKAKQLHITKVSDLKRLAPQLSFGAPATFFERKDGYDGMTKMYGLSFGKKVTLNEDLMYKAVANGNVDVITAFTTDPRIKQMNLKILEDDMKYFPPYDAAPVVRQAVLRANPGLEKTLNGLAGKITIPDMMKMNDEVNSKRKTPQEAARDFLKSKGLIPR